MVQPSITTAPLSANMSSSKRAADEDLPVPKAKKQKMSIGPSPANANSSMPVAMGGRLPNEILDMIFAAALEPETKPVINFLEADFSRTNELHQPDPAFYLPTSEAGSKDICKLSHYRSNLGIGKISWGANQQALKAPERDRQRAKREGKKLIEITAQVNRHKPSNEKTTGKTLTIQLDPSKDLLCLQAALHNTQWFMAGTDPWEWSRRTFFRPLWPRGIDKLERLAIDWKTETTRGTLSPRCGNNVCSYLSNVYNCEIYLVRGTQRKYCSWCTGDLLNAMNAACGSFDALSQLVDGEFAVPGRFCGLGGSNEEGQFVCGYCRVTYPAAEGRTKIEEGVLVSSWKPKCLNWHDPTVQSDIETLFMGRMRRLREFYLVCTDITLKDGREAPKGKDEFVGNGARFVVVEEDDDRWDLSKVRGSGYRDWRPNGVFDVDPFGYAKWLEDIAWESYWRFPRIYATRSRQAAEAEGEVMPQDAEDDVVMQDVADANNAMFGGRGQKPTEGESGNIEEDSREDDDEENGAYGYWDQWVTGVAAAPNQQWPMTEWFGRDDHAIPEIISSLERADKFFPVKCRILTCIQD